MATHDDRLVGLEAPPPLELQVLSCRNGHSGLQSGALLQREEWQAALASGARIKQRHGWKIRGQKCVGRKMLTVNPGVFTATVTPMKKKTKMPFFKRHATSPDKDDLDFHFRPGTALDGEHQIESFIYHSELLQCLTEPRLLTHQGGHVAQGVLKLLFFLFLHGVLTIFSLQRFR